jgi:succinyl-CoA synthetase beta subunit/citryl-CoA synthetase large subunit
MRLLEHQSKTLLARYGLSFTTSRVCTTRDDAEQAARALGGSSVVVKAQVPCGGRGKAGAVVFAESAVEAGAAAERLLAMSVRGHAVRAVSIEAKLAIYREFYVGIAWDTGSRLPVAILSTTGGMDVERSSERCVVRRTFDPFIGLHAFEGRQMARQLGIEEKTISGVGTVLHQLAKSFLDLDGVTIEINPLAETTDGALIGLDAHVELEDDAAFRTAAVLHELGPIENFAAGRPPTPLELEAQRIDAMDHRGVAGRVVEFDGDLALLIGGGGASLTVFDAIRRYGGKPADYCEVGGNPTEEKVAALTALLLSKPGVREMAVIMNVVNNTRADVMARGAIEGVRRAGRLPSETIIVFRVPGSWEPEAIAILAEAGVVALGRDVSLDAAAKLAVERSGGPRAEAEPSPSGRGQGEGVFVAGDSQLSPIGKASDAVRPSNVKSRKGGAHVA